MIRLTVPSIDQNDIDAVSAVLSTGFLVQGDHVTSFEQAIAKYVGVKSAIATSNCTSALQIALKALGTGPGDLVIVTAYSWIATANVIELCNAQPVFVDIKEDTFNIDTDLLEDILKKLMNKSDTAKRVKAIVPVHTFGQMSDMDSIIELSKRFDIPVVEDSACALGATLNGQQAGSWGNAACFSFHPRKAITTGEGGMIVTNDEDLAQKLRTLRNHGLDTQKSPPDFTMPGMNCRLTDFQAALGQSQMKKLDKLIAARKKLAASYNSLLRDGPLGVPTIASGHESVYQSYVVTLPREISPKRNLLISGMRTRGIETTIGTVHMPLSDFYQKRYGYTKGNFPITDRAYANSLTIPMYDTLTNSDQKRIVNELDTSLRSLGFNP